MPARRKIDLEKVRASLATPCPHCGHQIAPAEIQRTTFDQIKCPKCGTTSSSSPTRRTS